MAPGDTMLPDGGLIGSSSSGSDPRYHVVVGLHGRDEPIGGVEMARTRKRAEQLLAAVNQGLSTSTKDEFDRRYDLGEIAE